MKTTQKAKLEQFDSLQREHGLLERYFWDSRADMKPDAVVREKTNHGDRCKFSVYGTDKAHGGYVVIEWNPGTPSLIYWEAWSDLVRRMVGGPSGEVEATYQRAVEQITRILAQRNEPKHNFVTDADDIRRCSRCQKPSWTEDRCA